MSEDAAQGTATAPEGDGGNAALNPVFRTAPTADPAAQQGTATPKPAGRQGAAQGDDSRSPEELLAEAAENGDEEDPLAKAQAEITKWKTQARDNEKRAKANAAKAQQYDAHEESQKTEQQKLADRASAAEARAAQAEARYHRTLAAATYDLPPSMIDQLGDGTEDEISERAEKLAAAINERAAVLAAAQTQVNGQPRNGAGGGFGRPVESLRPGGMPAGDSQPKDANAWMRSAITNRK